MGGKAKVKKSDICESWSPFDPAIVGQWACWFPPGHTGHCGTPHSNMTWPAPKEQEDADGK